MCRLLLTTRITFNGARAGLLPPRMAAVTRTKVPVASVLIYTGLMVLLAVIPYATMHGNAISIFSDEAGIGTVPILVVYLLANVALPGIHPGDPQIGVPLRQARACSAARLGRPGLRGL